MEWIEGSETSDKGFGLIVNWVPVRTLEFDFEVSFLLGESGGVVGTKTGSYRGEYR